MTLFSSTSLRTAKSFETEKNSSKTVLSVLSMRLLGNGLSTFGLGEKVLLFCKELRSLFFQSTNLKYKWQASEIFSRFHFTFFFRKAHVPHVCRFRRFLSSCTANINNCTSPLFVFFHTEMTQFTTGKTSQHFWQFIQF